MVTVLENPLVSALVKDDLQCVVLQCAYAKIMSSMVYTDRRSCDHKGGAYRGILFCTCKVTSLSWFPTHDHHSSYWVLFNHVN